ncbi:MAG TPA: HAD-IA family hydrolase [Candidatus Saccharimonas sp.]|nr:HAD-IA family hydrolase [Candidatus Saccharimonas sp.]
MIQAFVFDCFGVLYNDAFKDFLQRNAGKVGDRAAYLQDLCNQSDAGLISNEQFYGELAAISGENPIDLYADFHSKRHLNRQLIGLIRELKPRYKIGMLSNSGRDFLDEFIAEHDIASDFDVTIASSETGYIKPQREIFEILAERLGLPLGDIYFVDDSPSNVQAAQGYGMQAHIYTSVDELKTAIASLLT